jgi:hypothetical protein
MITTEQISAAYDALMQAETAQYEAEEKRIEAANARESAFMKAMDRARLEDEISDPGKLQQRGERGSREELTALHIAEKAARKAQHEYRLAGMKVDSLNKQVEASKV